MEHDDDTDDETHCRDCGRAGFCRCHEGMDDDAPEVRA